MVCVNNSANKHHERSTPAWEILDVPTSAENSNGKFVGINESHWAWGGWKRNFGDFHDHIPGRAPQGRKATFLSGPPKVRRSSLHRSRKTKWNRAKKRAGSQKISNRAFNLAVMLRWAGQNPETASEIDNEKKEKEIRDSFITEEV